MGFDSKCEDQKGATGSAFPSGSAAALRSFVLAAESAAIEADDTPEDSDSASESGDEEFMRKYWNGERVNPPKSRSDEFEEEIFNTKNHIESEMRSR